MNRRRNPAESTPKRLAFKDVADVRTFAPWWVRCAKCSHLAYLMPYAVEKKGECKCISCGAVYYETLNSPYAKLHMELPLWFKANFRRHVFWALNEDHLDMLERVIRATLRERPVSRGRRLSFTSIMPFNLPSWLLSAKNRPDLLKLIQRLRKSIP
jgi:hypothetical protein